MIQFEVDRQQAKLIVQDDTDEYRVVEDTLVGHNRWTVSHRVIIQRVADGKYFKSNYTVGATESQDEYPYDYDDPIFKEVEKKEKLVTVYE